MHNRPPIPEPVKRQLRQEAGFGCVICGHPIYDYHHIVEWANEQHNRPEDMMILCPNHHREIPTYNEREQRSFKSNPKNIRTGFVSGRLRVNQEWLVIIAGNVEFVTLGTVFAYDGEAIVSMTLSPIGTLLLSLKMHDTNGILTLLIEDNEWIYGDPSVWDLRFKHNKLIIIEKKRTTSFVLDASGSYLRIKGELRFRGLSLKISDDMIDAKHTAAANARFGWGYLCFANSYLEFDNGGGCSIVPQSHLSGGGSFISNPNQSKRIEQAIIAYHKLFEEHLKMSDGNI